MLIFQRVRAASHAIIMSFFCPRAFSMLPPNPFEYKTRLGPDLPRPVPDGVSIRRYNIYK